MKIHKKSNLPPPFNPIIIELETKEELEQLTKALGVTNLKEIKKAYPGYNNELDMIYKLYDKLEDIRKEE